MVTAVFNPILNIDNEKNSRVQPERTVQQQHKRTKAKLQGNIVQMWRKMQEDGNDTNSMNSFWGDNTDDKDYSELRIISCNINGLSEVDELSQYIIGSLQLSSDIAYF